MAKKQKPRPKKGLSVAEVAKYLGASAVVPLHHSNGLEVTFVRPIQVSENGSIIVVGSGAVFPPECIAGFDVDRNTVILSEDYEAWYNLSTGMVLFMSPAPSRPRVCVRINKISSINKLSSGLNLLSQLFL